MNTPYAALLQLPEPSRMEGLFQNGRSDERVTMTTAIAVAAHIRSFYRMLGILAILLIVSGVGIASVIIGYIKIKSCPESYDESRLLSIFGITDIILCGIIATIVCEYFTRIFSLTFLNRLLCVIHAVMIERLVSLVCSFGLQLFV